MTDRADAMKSAGRGSPGRVQTLADKAEALLQSEIISGRLPPEERLVLPSLENRLGIGLTPLREALSRLVAHGLVTVEGNKGFRVSSISMDDLVDITKTRVIVECGALRLSMENREEEWEEGLVGATHRLVKTVGQLQGPISENLEKYDAAHWNFHRALLAGCGIPRLMSLQGDLYDQAYRYRRLMAEGGMNPQRVIEEHQLLSDLALGTDIEAACRALARHLTLTLEAVFPDAPLPEDGK